MFWRQECPHVSAHHFVFQMWTSAVRCQMLAGEICAVWTRTEATCACPGACTTSPSDLSRTRLSPFTQTPRWDFQTPSLLLRDLWSPATPGWGARRSACWDTLPRRTVPVSVSVHAWFLRYFHQSGDFSIQIFLAIVSLPGRSWINSECGLEMIIRVGKKEKQTSDEKKCWQSLFPC